MTTENEQALPQKSQIKKRKERPVFTMESWEDERLARKFIRPHFDDIRQRLKDDGVNTQFRKVRHEDGQQSYAIFYGREMVDKKGNKSIVYSDNDYLAIHFDPQRKFPKAARRSEDSDDDSSKSAKKGKTLRKMKDSV